MIGGKKIALNTMFLIAASLLNAVISLVTTAIIARSIGPELYGRYTFGLTYILMFSVIANFGLESLFIRETARNRSTLAHFNDIFHLKVALSIMTILSVVVSAHLLRYSPETLEVLYILCIGLFFQILSESLLSVYRSIEKMQVTAFFSSLFRILSATVVIISAYSGLGFYGIVAAFSIGNALVFLSVLWLFRREFHLLHARAAYSNWFGLIKNGLPFYLSALLTMFYAKINIIMLSKLVPEREIGFYMAALNLVENLYFIPTAFNTAVFPAFSRLYGSSLNALQKAYAKIAKYLIIITVAVASGTILVSEHVILLVYGREFVSAVSLLNVLIFLWVFAFFSNMQSSLLFSIGQEKVQVKVMALATVINTVLNLLFINAYGVMGAAYASVATEAIVVIMITGILWRLHYRYPFDYYLLRLAVIVIVMSISVRYLLQFNIGAAIAGGGICFTSLLFILKVFDEEDLMYMKSLLRRPTEDA